MKISLRNFKIIIFTINRLITIWIWTRLCIFHPFDKHTAWEWEYKEGYGSFPDSETLARYGQ